LARLFAGGSDDRSPRRRWTDRVKQGERIRFEIEIDEPFSFEIRGLGVSQSIESSSIISFKAHKAGQFPVIASAALIGVADLLIKGGR
jgi:hypothetical protein